MAAAGMGVERWAKPTIATSTIEAGAIGPQTGETAPRPPKEEMPKSGQPQADSASAGNWTRQGVLCAITPVGQLMPVPPSPQ